METVDGCSYFNEMPQCSWKGMPHPPGSGYTGGEMETGDLNLGTQSVIELYKGLLRLGVVTSRFRISTKSNASQRHIIEWTIHLSFPCNGQFHNAIQQLATLVYGGTNKPYTERAMLVRRLNCAVTLWRPGSRKNWRHGLESDVINMTVQTRTSTIKWIQYILFSFG